MLLTFLLVWLPLFIFDCIYPKLQTHLMMNGLHTPALDTFFKYVTHLGEGFGAYLGVFILFWSRRKGLFILLGQGLTCLITQILKFAFAHPRPATFFDQMGADLPETVPGVSLRRAFNSFPSGHTSAAFALFTCLQNHFAEHHSAGDILYFCTFCNGRSVELSGVKKHLQNHG